MERTKLLLARLAINFLTDSMVSWSWATPRWVTRVSHTSMANLHRWLIPLVFNSYHWGFSFSTSNYSTYFHVKDSTLTGILTYRCWQCILFACCLSCFWRSSLLPRVNTARRQMVDSARLDLVVRSCKILFKECVMAIGCDVVVLAGTRFKPPTVGGICNLHRILCHRILGSARVYIYVFTMLLTIHCA